MSRFISIQRGPQLQLHRFAPSCADTSHQCRLLVVLSPRNATDVCHEIYAAMCNEPAEIQKRHSLQRAPRLQINPDSSFPLW